LNARACDPLICPYISANVTQLGSLTFRQSEVSCRDDHCESTLQKSNDNNVIYRSLIEELKEFKFQDQSPRYDIVVRATTRTRKKPRARFTQGDEEGGYCIRVLIKYRNYRVGLPLVAVGVLEHLDHVVHVAAVGGRHFSIAPGNI